MKMVRRKKKSVAASGYIGTIPSQSFLHISGSEIFVVLYIGEAKSKNTAILPVKELMMILYA